MRRFSVIAAVALTVASAATGVAGASGPPGVPERQDGQLRPAHPAPQDDAKTVTLITGDKVTISSSGHSVRPGKGRKVNFSTLKWKDHLVVLPSDAAPLVARGLLDERLFDVTQLIEWKYDDAHREDVPVIARTTGAAAFRISGVPAPTWRSGTLGLAAVKVPKSDATTTWQALSGGAGARSLAGGVGRLWLDGKRMPSLDASVPQVGAPEAWKSGYTGKGVTVAVLDTGYDPAHPDLKGVVTHGKSFSTYEPDVNDHVGHGTHVASTIAGTGAASGGKYRGVAPDAKIAVGKVLSELGGYDSEIVAGMEWAANEVKAKVVNMSLGGRDDWRLDPVEEAVNVLSERTGALFVVAAGNEGPGESTVGSPGSADAALTVGAVDKQDQLAGFSSRGPRVGDGAIKPEITAPGVDITAAVPGTAEGSYGAYSGTSMATPHVAGAAAILAQRHPDWRGERLKSALISSATPHTDSNAFEQGAGRLEAAKALTQTVVAIPGNVSSVLRWPHEKGQQTTKAITYTNTGDAAVTFDLAIAPVGGGALPAGVLSLSADRLTVPAKGEATVTVTVAADGITPGAYAGVVTATSGDTVVRTLAGAYVEPESYDLTVTTKGGEPGQTGWVLAYNFELQQREWIEVRDGTGSVRLPAGEWFVDGTFDGEQGKVTMAWLPSVRLGEQTRNLTIDLGAGKEVVQSVDDPAARRHALALTTRQDHGEDYIGISYFFPNEERLFVVPSQAPGLSFAVHSSLVKAGTTPSPYRYDLYNSAEGGLPSDPVYKARKADLAKVTVNYRGAGVPGDGLALVGPYGGELIDTPLHVPATVVHYRSPVKGLKWQSGMVLLDENGLGHHSADSGREITGRSDTEVWNTAVFGAAPSPYSMRYGDYLQVDGVPFSDSGAGRLSRDENASVAVSLAKDGKELARKTCEPPDGAICLPGTRVPAGESVFTVTMSARRQVPYAALSSAVDAKWTFRSGTTTEITPLPMLNVRAAPQGLDELNRARRSALTPIRLLVEQGAEPPAALDGARPKAEVSFDEGKTWRAAPVTRVHGQWTALVRNPAAGDFVSLRLSADSGDTTFAQTVIRAYGLTS
ncbi:peptidase S8 [Spongiactinospora rosea]|uniref:Peptidase S8 n=1 Tax=Spongiactinospora rosea TaxID=2248750 RepID=A0A366LWD2_9ACTN|nr:S8 family peptidase [Spongiactinospora rosea]RBQ18231.1 peptidase S8 [Spongiactinospora rosea]